MNRAALYLRSSKDRHDVSIDVQRAELKRLATQRSLTIVEEFVDVVESGKDEDRPGFLRLIQSVRNDRRGWATLLVLDTSRLARRRLIALLFEEQECARHAVRVVYKTLPESMDPGMEVILKSQLQAMDEWHSITSRQKGLAGMAQNVRSGFRAGGRAPLGYRLVRTPTGAVRDGLPVTKSRLEPDEHATAVKQYLVARAAGVRRMQAARASGLKTSKGSLVGMEWNALTYAGHTVWNVHASRKGGHAVGGHRRRPRSEWQIQRDTHEAFITESEAERILAGLAAYSAKRARRTNGKYLLTGLLRTPAGARYYGESSADAYRVRGRYVPREALERAVVGKVMGDLATPAFIGALVNAAHAADAGTETRQHGQALRDRVTDLVGRISKMMDMAADLKQPGPALRKIDELEQQRVVALAALEQWEGTQAQCTALARIDAHSVKRALTGLVEGLQESERDQVKTALDSLVEKIELDPSTLACHIHYRVHATTGEHTRMGAQWQGLGSVPRGDATLFLHEPVIRLVVPVALRLKDHQERQFQPSGTET